MTIVSVGYEGRTVEDLVAVLERHRVKLVVDVRLTPVSRKRGFSKKALAAALAQQGIEYMHEPALGNPRENRDAYRAGVIGARRRYERRLANGARKTFRAMMELAQATRTALLCFEREHDHCHRSSIVAAALRDEPSMRLLSL